MAEKVYLDDSGNPIQKPKVYLDEQGNPVGQPRFAQSLLDSRRAASKSEFDANQPESTVMSRMDTAGQHAKDAIVGTGKGLWDLMTKGPMHQLDVIKNTPSAIKTATVQPSKDIYAGIRDRDFDKAAGGAMDFLTQTVPTVTGLVEGGTALTKGVKAGVKARLQYAQEPGAGIFRRTPVDTVKRALPAVETEHLERGFTDLKNHAEPTVGPVKDVPKVLEGEEHVANHLNEQVQNIITPQKDMVVPESRAKFVEEQIKAIPDDIKLHDPARYDALVQEVEQQKTLGDMTIGEINDARVSANKLRRNYYNSKTGAQLTKDEQLQAALLGGRDKAAHALFDYGINQVGLGGAAEARQLSQRLGSLIRVREGAEGMLSKAELEAGTPVISRFGKRAGTFFRQLSGAPNAFDVSPGVNVDIASGMRRWQGTVGKGADAVPKGSFEMRQPSTFQRSGTPPPITPPPAARAGAPPTLRGQQTEAVPTNGPGMFQGQQTRQAMFERFDPKQPEGQQFAPPTAEAESASRPYQPGMAPMDEVMRRQHAGVAPTPELRSPGQLSLEQGMAPDLFGTRVQGQPYAGGSELSPEGYASAQQQRQLWQSGAPAKAPGQIDMFQQHGFGMGPTPEGPAWQDPAPHPRSMLGVDQTQFKWQPSARETYTMQDLNSMAREIADYLNKHGGGSQRQELLKDLEDIQHELWRRQEARRPGPAQPYRAGAR